MLDVLSPRPEPAAAQPPGSCTRSPSRASAWGGAGPGRLTAEAEPGETHGNGPPLGNAELVQLRVRIVALENLVIALLSTRQYVTAARIGSVEPFGYRRSTLAKGSKSLSSWIRLAIESV